MKGIELIKVIILAGMAYSITYASSEISLVEPDPKMSSTMLKNTKKSIKKNLTIDKRLSHSINEESRKNFEQHQKKIKTYNQEQLNNSIKDAEAMEEELRNRRNITRGN